MTSSSSEYIDCGIVRGLNRHPVKSMRSEPVSQAYLDWYGLEGDRRYAFIRGEVHSDFPWLTARELPEMLLYTPRFTQPDDPRNSPVVVTTPDGRQLPLGAPELLAELQHAHGEAIYLVKLRRGSYDNEVLSLISTASVASLGQSAGMDLPSARFRQNVVVETPDGRPFQEEAWLGRSVLFGDDDDGPRIRIYRRIVRCVMLNIDPDTAERDPRVLKAVTQTRNSCAGLYAFVERPGTIRVGNAVRVMTATG